MSTKRKTRKKSSSPRVSSVQISAAKKAVHKRKKRRAHKPKGMLSEMMSPERAQKTAGAIISGAIGGGAINVASKLIPNKWGNGARVLTGALLSFTTGVVFNMPNLSAGMAGATAYQILDKKMLGEGEDEPEMEEAEFTDSDVLEEMPLLLNENGEELMEDENGNLVSLAEANYIKLQQNQPQYYAPYNRQY